MPDMAKDLLDLQSELDGSLKALQGLRDLFIEASGHGRQFQVLGPDGICELICMVEDRFSTCEKLLQAYVTNSD